MYAKWDAKCDSRIPYLWLRNNVFYCRLELPRVNGKRRYKRVSLHTSNFYEAREKLRLIMIKSNPIIENLRKLYNELIFEEENNVSSGDSFDFISKSGQWKRISRRNNPETINNLVMQKLLADFALKGQELNPEDRKLLQDVSNLLPQLTALLEKIPTSPTVAPAPLTRKISEVIDDMLLKGNNCQSEQTRKRNTLTRLLSVTGLTPDDDYAKFHTISTINVIAKHIVEQTELKGDLKRKQLRYIKELATCGSNIDPDNYKSNVVANLPKVDKTKKADKTPHKPYSKQQLLDIFNPKHTYLQENMDVFFVCLVALFTGARANSALTLQYGDIIAEDGIPCIRFIENHPIKNLKNEASERTVPIHPQLLDIGFVDYVKHMQAIRKAKDNDFIFPKCITKGKLYNNKYVVRNILSFFKEIGVKKESNDGFDFHSFRKNISIAMQDAHIPASYINDIIGWEGKTTMEKNYSNHTLQQIFDQMSKFEYDFLNAHFATWKNFFAQKKARKKKI